MTREASRRWDATQGRSREQGRRLVPGGGPSAHTCTQESRGVPGGFQNGRVFPKSILGRSTLSSLTRCSDGAAPVCARWGSAGALMPRVSVTRAVEVPVTCACHLTRARPACATPRRHAHRVCAHTRPCTLQRAVSCSHTCVTRMLYVPCAVSTHHNTIVRVCSTRVYMLPVISHGCIMHTPVHITCVTFTWTAAVGMVHVTRAT